MGPLLLFLRLHRIMETFLLGPERKEHIHHCSYYSKFHTCGENKGKHCQSSIFTFHLNPIFLFRTNCKKTYSLRDDLVYYGVEKNICKLETPEDSLLPPGHASLLLLLPGVSEYFHVLLSHLASWARGQDTSSIYHLQDNVITRQIIGRFLTRGQRFWIC